LNVQHQAGLNDEDTQQEDQAVEQSSEGLTQQGEEQRSIMQDASVTVVVEPQALETEGSPSATCMPCKLKK
jgi:hypothetical protein